MDTIISKRHWLGMMLCFALTACGTEVTSPSPLEVSGEAQMLVPDPTTGSAGASSAADFEEPSCSERCGSYECNSGDPVSDCICQQAQCRCFEFCSHKPRVCEWTC